ncbi:MULTISPECIES: LysR family transcriptional regulator ArgP [Corynebacterium]|uniref:LysR family transcriptional regulator ArgP n=1 Tax=Corynebacterium TaxID=1716 RepID=UPI00124DCB89|nr:MULTISPECIES: LysR family transcriptional regulator ArgP [Corynebacterium]
MDNVKLNTLLAVVDEGSFEAAASRLGISPSAVSQRIKALENTIGRVLLKRANPVRATEAGEILVQAGRRMALLQAETNAQLRGRLGRVPLAIAINADSLSTWFRPVLADVASWNSASLRLRIEDESHSRNLLRRGDVLGAVTREAEAVSGCESHYLGVMRYRAAAHPRLLDTYTRPDGSLDWASMPALRYGPNDELQEHDLLGRLRSGEDGRHRSVSWIPSSEDFVYAARVGLGWGLLPETQLRPLLDSGDVVLLDDSVEEVHLYWQHWRLESPILGALSDAVLDAATALEQ